MVCAAVYISVLILLDPFTFLFLKLPKSKSEALLVDNHNLTETLRGEETHICTMWAGTFCTLSSVSDQEIVSK